MIPEVISTTNKLCGSNDDSEKNLDLIPSDTNSFMKGKIMNKKIKFSKFGKTNKNYSFMSEVMFEHVLLILFKSKILCNNSLAILSAVHPLFQHLLNSSRRHEKFNISALKRIDENWSIQTTIPYVKQ